MKQKRDRYEMHKYWGKKPANDLRGLIEKYSKPGDTVLDPFSGYGVLGCEAFILNRNVILNDLNPIANFLNVQLLEKDVDLNLLKRQWYQIKAEFEPYNEQWFGWDAKGVGVQLMSVLRNSNDIPIKGKFRMIGETKSREVELEIDDVKKFLEFEDSYKISDWFPDAELIRNSRISAKEGMTVADLFTKRTLACHARLFSLIEQYSSGTEKKLFTMAFTANLANCSRLVPPIKSRGDMAPGAWMTGFYVAETYLENNVLFYFENRLSKVIKGKQDYLRQFGVSGEIDFGEKKYNNTYLTLQNDAKDMQVASESIDYVFTDPPYGDAVPYFEQSILWNSWLGRIPDYANEIVVSDSKERGKGQAMFELEIEAAFSEIRRVLKPGKYFSLTYHSLSGLEWKAITNACIKNGFELVEYLWLVQKSFTPRQINRLTTVKGDVLVTLRKGDNPLQSLPRPDSEIAALFKSQIKKWLKEVALDTNEIFLRIMKMVFAEKILIGEVDLLKILNENFVFQDNQKWVFDGRHELSTIR